ncbi:1,25-dihydroxyvitamin D(3) 24-hydroxylase, mitochondrial [Aplysia californica]|uniref:1,25-dihydroxyvitamin D(3) 24-hydroxylase, mitochondrial n=1 Tax=Aplysia californica TaxID=6500 RepID=A0ABM1VUD9_APLCA|nr:1,25-dihydroxyvitamin D(3) 24-hydroxylase, mitochondrial [Aplysia californica]XP_035826032.1 1,25-dihydroxyvitamin D(3) 24-hydroxylase, mitochondrial [Aplysia californica]XP_035826033.1 1,25-dihydroxyvitamin D(3) 24-hydroxylase, mitochondrial [Aplysia californica]
MQNQLRTSFVFWGLKAKGAQPASRCFQNGLSSCGCVRGLSFNKSLQCRDAAHHRNASTTVQEMESMDLNPEPIRSVPKPFSSMPSPKGLPYLGSALEIAKNVGKLHHFHLQRVKDYGPVWREKAGAMDFVHVACAEGVEDIIRCEGATPFRMPIVPHTEYYKVNSRPEGILVSNGQQWRRMRSALEKPILKPSLLSNHVSTMHTVSSDFVRRLDALRNDHGDITDILSELFKWSLEAASVVLYNRRLGCISLEPLPGIEDFIQAATVLNTLMGESLIYPLFVLKTYKRKLWTSFQEAFDKVVAIAEKEIDKIPDDPKAHSLVSHIMSHGNLTSSEMYTNVTEIMLASGDTTSTWAHHTLWELCHRPLIQDKVYQEIKTVVGEVEEVSHSTLGRLKYTTGFLKEILRLHPPVFMTGRELENGGVICGYQVPPGTTTAVPLYAIGRDPNIYKDPMEIKPERWMRTARDREVTNTFAFVPFGWGQRSCIGRRIATANMQLLLIELLRRFRLTSVTKELTLETRLTLTPNPPMQLTLTPRE